MVLQLIMAARKTHGIFPLLISCFILFPVWFYGQTFFESLYKKQILTPFWSAFAGVIVFGLFAITGAFIGIKKKILQKEREPEILLEIS